IFLLLAIAAALGLSFYLRQFEQIAQQFDLDEVHQMESASLLFDRNGEEIGKLFLQNRHPVTLKEISPYLIQAVIAAEDNRFYQHEGVDWYGVIRAFFENIRQGRITQGASTITQQLARNTYEMRERTYQRKIIEMFLAKRIEKRFSKQQIMEMYLNRVYFGSGFYGAESAARGYFGKPASELTIGECAMLAGLLRSPQTLSPWNNLHAAENIRNVVLRQMRDLGFISSRQLREESDKPLKVQPRTNPHRVSYSHDLIRQQAIAALGFERAMNGGYKIYTTLDKELQNLAESSLAEQLAEIEQTPGYVHETYSDYRRRHADEEARIDRGNLNVRLPPPNYLQGALLALENSSGAILAMVGGRDFRHSEYNRAFQARRPIGTAFTPFVFASAYENNIPPNTLVDDSCIDNRFVMVGGETGILGEWGVEREDNQYEGPLTATLALMKGKNAATVRLGFLLGLDRFRKTLT
ncbi:MAG: transglycosylase domain-containing protein, partial [Chthoniobacterales bacterium]|nr:transglycosylase domain-containing protein [Chthoniobacterales bacterium]